LPLQNVAIIDWHKLLAIESRIVMYIQHDTAIFLSGMRNAACGLGIGFKTTVSC